MAGQNLQYRNLKTHKEPQDLSENLRPSRLSTTSAGPVACTSRIVNSLSMASEFTQSHPVSPQIDTQVPRTEPAEVRGMAPAWLAASTNSRFCHLFPTKKARQICAGCSRPAGCDSGWRSRRCCYRRHCRCAPEAGVSEADAHTYAEGVRRGDGLAASARVADAERATGAPRPSRSW